MSPAGSASRFEVLPVLCSVQRARVHLRVVLPDEGPSDKELVLLIAEQSIEVVQALNAEPGNDILLCGGGAPRQRLPACARPSMSSRSDLTI